MSIRTMVSFLVLFYMNPLTNSEGPGFYLRVPLIRLPIGPRQCDLSCFQAGMGWLKNRLFGDLWSFLETLGAGLGDHLVIMGAHMNPWGAM